MKLLVVTLLLLLTSDISAALERGKEVPVTETVTDDINPSYTGKWGWHTVHKKTVRKTASKFQKGASLPKKDICSKCHKKNEYRIYDPHTQLTEKGEILREKCLYCHLEKPDEKSATFAKNHDEIKFVRSLEKLCLGCHSKQYRLAHPVNANHLLIPSSEMHAMMKASEDQYGIILPLNFEGEIMCATCHNPHERGVIPSEKSAAKGASEEFRVRLIGQSDTTVAKEANDNSAFHISGPVHKICLTCHKDKAAEGWGKR